jgi:hypothetical protein
MTMVMRTNVDEIQRVQMGTTDLVVAMDRDTKRLLSYINVSDRSAQGTVRTLWSLH